MDIKKEKKRKEFTMLETKNLIKKFGGKTALNDISFQIEPGKTYLLLGPNGSGKTDENGRFPHKADFRVCPLEQHPCRYRKQERDLLYADRIFLLSLDERDGRRELLCRFFRRF